MRATSWPLCVRSQLLRETRQAAIDYADTIVVEEADAMTVAERIDRTLEQSRRAREAADRRVAELRREASASRERAAEARRVLRRAGYLR